MASRDGCSRLQSANRTIVTNFANENVNEEGEGVNGPTQGQDMIAKKWEDFTTEGSVSKCSRRKTRWKESWRGLMRSLKQNLFSCTQPHHRLIGWFGSDGGKKVNAVLFQRNGTKSGGFLLGG